MSNEDLFNIAGREFDQIVPGFSAPYMGRISQGFQINTISSGLRFVDSVPYTASGDVPGQVGPSAVSSFMGFGSDGSGTGAGPINFFNIVNNPPTSGTANPESVPAIGPEERIRYSCVDGTCLQDPNGIYLRIDECLAGGCLPGGGGGGGGGECEDCCECNHGTTHTIFKAKILNVISETGLTGGTCVGKYWEYTWIELLAPSSTATARSYALSGDKAYNVYECSIPDSGGNTVPSGSTIVRKRIPNNAIVPMYLDEEGKPWFHMENPLQVTCDE